MKFEKMCRLSFFVCLLLLALGCSKGGEQSGEKSGEKAETGDHGHAHAKNQGPHEGLIASLKGVSGVIELKLHDDKGDLELWISKDKKITQPIDLPLDAVVKITFSAPLKRVVELKVRNSKHNEDEDGTPNIRDGKTNYFIFPGTTGASAEWLKGKGFSSSVVVSFELDGKTVTSEPFVLAPHVH